MEAQRTDLETVLSVQTTQDGEERTHWALQLRAAASEVDRLTRKLDERSQEIAQLSRMVLAAEERAVALESITASFRIEAVGWFGRAIMLLYQSLAGTLKSSQDQDADLVTLIGDAGLFDEAWYLQRYPDVARAGVDPLRHYIMHGINEGREPRDLSLPLCGTRRGRS